MSYLLVIQLTIIITMALFLKEFIELILGEKRSKKDVG